MNTQANNSISKHITVMVVLVMLMLSGVGFAQNTIEVPATAATSSVASNSSMNMVSWFMGTKQTTNENTIKESNSKRQMMTNGIAPNRLLIKTFLKKASQYASNIA